MHNYSEEEDILVYIEDYNLLTGTVTFDFIDSNEYNTFLNIIGRQSSIDGASMFQIINYYQKKIQENTIYIIKKKVFQKLSQSIEYIENSYIIGYRINLSDIKDELFYKSKALNFEEKLTRNISNEHIGDLGLIPSVIGRNLKVNVRYVGQGNWNEIITENTVKVVFDIGAPLNSSIPKITSIISNKEVEYFNQPVGIIISHWDIDHYHCLKGLSDKVISNLNFFICRSNLPTLTSRVIFSKIKMLLPKNKFFSISPCSKLTPHKPAFTLYSNLSDQLLIFNGHEHKNRNKSGIALLVKNHNASIVLPGDCDYKQISDFILPHIDKNHRHNLVVPHHGGKAGNFIYNFKKLKPVRAIISVGKNSYGHPLQNTIDSLRKINFKVSQTNHKAQDIVVNLH